MNRRRPRGLSARWLPSHADAEDLVREFYLHKRTCPDCGRCDDVWSVERYRLCPFGQRMRGLLDYRLSRAERLRIEERAPQPSPALCRAARHSHQEDPDGTTHPRQGH